MITKKEPERIEKELALRLTPQELFDKTAKYLTKKENR
jgi:hypothetical protein